MLSEMNLEDMLQGVPKLNFAFDGDCAQAIGVDLPVAVINLAHRTDRWQAVSGRMAGIGLNKLIKVPAVEGARLSLPAIAPLLAQPHELIEAAPRSHFTMTRPAIGCFLSHLAIWQWMIENKLPRVLVLEDDATPAVNFDAARFRRVFSSIPRESDLVFPGCIIMNGMAEEPRASDLARLYYFNGTFAYMITPAACRKLIPHLVPLDGHIDHRMSKVLVERRHELVAHYVAPAFFEPDWSLRSDCYVPLVGETDADRAMAALLNANRKLLLGDGRPLLAPVG